MKSIIKRKWLETGMVLLVLFVCTADRCVRLEEVHINSSSYVVQAGDVTTITMKNVFTPFEESPGDRMVVSILAPKLWKLSEGNAELTYIDKDDPDVMETMSLIPLEISPKQEQWKGMTWAEALMTKYGVALNIEGSEMEWVTFWSRPYSLPKNSTRTATVTIKLKTSYDNVRCKLAFYLNNSNDGISDDNERQAIEMMNVCFETVGALSGVVDFCEEHCNAALPMFTTENDIVTLKYLSSIEVNDGHGNLVKTALYKAPEVYLCATAYTASSAGEHSYWMCTSKMYRENDVNYSLTFWPADYFGIPENESITRIEYYFTNLDRSVVVKEINDDGSESPFVYRFVCR